MDDERYATGLRLIEQIHGRRGIETLERLAETSPELSRQVIAYAFGEVYARAELDLKTRQLVTVIALAAAGNAAPQLEVHLHAALNLGWTREELVEALCQLAPYAGFPTAINAINVAARVLAARGDA